MTTRPDRNPLVPLINPSAATAPEVAENFRRIYAGSLADQRSIEAAGGVYAVRAAAPLEVTDEGIALNWQDPRVYEVVGGLVLNHPDSGKVKVDDGDEPDFLENQLVDYAGATDEWIAVDIVKPAAHSPLQARVAKADVRAANPPGGAGGTANELAIHWQPTAAGARTIQVIAGDCRGRLVRYWMAAGTTIANLQHCVTGDSSQQGIVTAMHGSWPNDLLGTAISHATIALNGTTNALEVTFSSIGADDVYFYVRVDDFGVIPSDGYQSYAQA
jgi:hypothetical protein